MTAIADFDEPLGLASQHWQIDLLRLLLRSDGVTTGHLRAFGGGEAVAVRRFLLWLKDSGLITWGSIHQCPTCTCNSTIRVVHRPALLRFLRASDGRRLDATFRMAQIAQARK